MSHTSKITEYDFDLFNIHVFSIVIQILPWNMINGCHLKMQTEWNDKKLAQFRIWQSFWRGLSLHMQLPS